MPSTIEEAISRRFYSRPRWFFHVVFRHHWRREIAVFPFYGVRACSHGWFQP